jgi:hypothetical protein
VCGDPGAWPSEVTDANPTRFKMRAWNFENFTQQRGDVMN